MLKTMRNNVKSLSWTLWLVILAFIGFIFVQWGTGELDREGLDKDVAAIDNTSISGEEFQKNLLRRLDMYSKQFKNNFSASLINQLGIAEQALQGMIHAQIILNEAKKLHLDVSDAELKNAIRSYPAFQQDGVFIGTEEYERRLAYSQIQVRDFEDDLKKELLSEKLKELLAGSLVLDVDKLEQEYRKENDKAELEIIALRSDEIKEEPAFSPAELEAYYQKNKSLFKSPEKRAADILVMKFNDYKKEIVLQEKDLFDYYKSKKNMFKVPGKTKVSRIWVAYTQQNREEILKQMDATAAILSGENFAAKARELSGDEKAKDGGDWGYWGWQQFSSQEKGMIGNLEAGEISTPVDAGQGFSILYASEKVEEKQETYDEVKTRIQGMLENERLKKLVSEKIARLYEKIKAAGNVKRGAGNMADRVMGSGLLTAGQAIAKVDEMGYISRQLFSLKENEVSQPLEFPDGFAIAQLNQVVKPEIEPFETSRDKVKTELLAAKKLQLQLARAGKVAAELNRLADAKKIEEYLKKENLKAEDISYQRGDRLGNFSSLPGLDDTIFAMSENAYAPPLTIKSEAAVIVRLKSKKLVSEADFASEKSGFYQKKLDEFKNSFFSSYVWNKRNDYKIRYNLENFERIKDYVTSKFR